MKKYKAILITPDQSVIDDFIFLYPHLKSMGLIFIKNKNDLYRLYGLRFTLEDVYFLHRWWEIEGVQDVVLRHANNDIKRKKQMNKTQNGSGASNLKQEHYIKPEDKVLEYFKKAHKILGYNKDIEYSPETTLEIIEIAKMIQLEEHREDK